MSLIIPWVFSAAMMGTGSQWPEPIAILLMMVFTFIGAAAYRAGGHIAVNMLTEKLPASIQRLLAGGGGCAHAGHPAPSWSGTAPTCVSRHGAGHQRAAVAAVGATSPLPMGAAITLLFVLEKIVWGLQGPSAHRAL